MHLFCMFLSTLKLYSQVLFCQNKRLCIKKILLGQGEMSKFDVSQLWQSWFECVSDWQVSAELKTLKSRETAKNTQDSGPRGPGLGTTGLCRLFETYSNITSPLSYCLALPQQDLRQEDWLISQLFLNPQFKILCHFFLLLELQQRDGTKFYYLTDLVLMNHFSFYAR